MCCSAGIEYFGLVGENRGDTEIEQLDLMRTGLAPGSDKNIGWLDVAVNDEVLMRVLNGAAHLQEKFQAAAYG